MINQFDELERYEENISERKSGKNWRKKLRKIERKSVLTITVGNTGKTLYYYKKNVEEVPGNWEIFLKY